MSTGGNLNQVLARLGQSPCPGVSEGFMDGVWERAGEMAERRDSRMRLSLFVGLAAIGLGAGATVAQAPAYAQHPTYLVSNEARLSPAVLLHLGP